MTEPDRKFEEEIRRALYAAGDLIVPAGDGLNKIRDRAARRPPVLGWLLAYTAHLPRQLVHGTRVAASEVVATAQGYSSLGLAFASARRWRRKAGHVLRTPSVWMRPMLAGATALILVIGVMFSIPRLRQQATAQLDSLIGNTNHHGPGNSSGPGGAPGSAQSSGATRLRTGLGALMLGEPWLATMPPGKAQCRSRGTNGGKPSPVSAVHPNVVPPGDLGPQPASVTCPHSSPPSKWSVGPLVTTPPTVPVTSPPTTPVVTSPPTTPVTTQTPTLPVDTSPPSPPPTTTSPPTTPPSTDTSSSNSTASTGPTGTAAPGG
jgi:hypothetical protein